MSESSLRFSLLGILVEDPSFLWLGFMSSISLYDLIFINTLDTQRLLMSFSGRCKNWSRFQHMIYVCNKMCKYNSHPRSSKWASKAGRGINILSLPTLHPHVLEDVARIFSKTHLCLTLGVISVTIFFLLLSNKLFGNFFLHCNINFLVTFCTRTWVHIPEEALGSLGYRINSAWKRARQKRFSNKDNTGCKSLL